MIESDPSRLELTRIQNDGTVHDANDIQDLAISVAKTSYGQQSTSASDSSNTNGFIGMADGDNTQGAGGKGYGWKSNLLKDVFSDKSGGLRDTHLYKWGDFHY